MNASCVGRNVISTLSNDDPAVEAVDLTRRFGHFVAVDGVSFSVRRGEIFGFLGPNGAGKTTTIRMLLSLIRPTSGRAFVLGLDAAQQALRIRQRIGYMSQKFSLYDDLSVAQNLAFFGGTYGVRGRRFQERRDYALHMAGLEGRAEELASHLSGGWRQRLALGCAILHDPEVLFLDEPTAGVDPISRRGFWDLLYDLSDQGRTIFVTTHYMDEAEHCHRLAFIQRGRIVAMGSPEAIKRESIHGLILEIDCDAPSEAVVRLCDSGMFSDVSLYGALIHAVMEGDDRSADEAFWCARAREILCEAGLGVREIDVIPPSLEDVFIASVREQGTR